MQNQKLKNLLKTDYVQISHYFDQELVIIDWQKPVSLEEFKFTYTFVFKYTKLKRVGKFVVDIQKKGFAPPQEEEWWNVNFAKHLSNIDFDIYVSMVVNDEQFRTLIQQFSLHWNNQYHKDDEHLNVNYFTSRSEATDWLLARNASVIDTQLIKKPQ